MKNEINDVFFTFIVNDKNKTFSIIGSLSDDEMDSLSKFINTINKNNGNFLYLVKFENDQLLNEQLAKINYTYQGYSLVSANDILDSFRLINIE